MKKIKIVPSDCLLMTWYIYMQHKGEQYMAESHDPLAIANYLNKDGDVSPEDRLAASQRLEYTIKRANNDIFKVVKMWN